MTKCGICKCHRIKTECCLLTRETRHFDVSYWTGYVARLLSFLHTFKCALLLTGALLMMFIDIVDVNEGEVVSFCMIKTLMGL